MLPTNHHSASTLPRIVRSLCSRYSRTKRAVIATPAGAAERSSCGNPLRDVEQTKQGQDISASGATQPPTQGRSLGATMSHMLPNTALLSPTGPRFHSTSSYQHPGGRLTSALPVISIAEIFRDTCPSYISRRCLSPSFPTYGTSLPPCTFLVPFAFLPPALHFELRIS